MTTSTRSLNLHHFSTAGNDDSRTDAGAECDAVSDTTEEAEVYCNVLDVDCFPGSLRKCMIITQILCVCVRRCPTSDYCMCVIAIRFFVPVVFVVVVAVLAAAVTATLSCFPYCWGCWVVVLLVLLPLFFG